MPTDHTAITQRRLFGTALLIPLMCPDQELPGGGIQVHFQSVPPDCELQDEAIGHL